MKELNPRIFWLAVLSGLLLTIGIAATMSAIAVTSSSTRTAQLWVDIVTRSLTVAAGLGGAFGLWLAFRRQQHSEHDAVQQRITELRIQAVEQIGSDKAAVRIGGLHNLERLANEHPELRQIILNEICTYLRMPYFPLNADDPDTTADDFWTVTQEREVRQTAQHILERHLADGDQYWDHDELNLAHAHLEGLTLKNSSLHNARFTVATFKGFTSFGGTSFHGDYAWFMGANFELNAHFVDTLFFADTSFKKATFAEAPDLTDAIASITSTVNDVPLDHVWPTGWRLNNAPNEVGLHQLVRDQPAT